MKHICLSGRNYLSFLDCKKDLFGGTVDSRMKTSVPHFDQAVDIICEPFCL